MPSAPRSRRLLAADQDENVTRALDWAEIAAMLGDFRDAVAWLDRAEAMKGSLPDEIAARRRDWIARAA
jgi:hypothetical protein